MSLRCPRCRSEEIHVAFKACANCDYTAEEHQRFMGARLSQDPPDHFVKLRGGLSDLLNSYCRGCRALTSVGEACDAHRWIFDSLNELESQARLPEGPWVLETGIANRWTYTHSGNGRRLYFGGNEAEAIAVRDALNRVASEAS